MANQGDTRLADLTRRLEAIASPAAPGVFLEATTAVDVTATVLQSMQLAIELELSTLPPYLCAMWSIQDSSSKVAALILNICRNEMLHMGLACNMMTALGGVPDIRNAYYTKISYPTDGLPGGVLAGLVVDLGSLTLNKVVNQFQQIELPEDQIQSASLADVPYTIGRFYDALSNALPSDPWPGGIQVKASFPPPCPPLTTINTLADAQAAIALIKQQGEGTSTSPSADGNLADLAHFYVYEEIAQQNTITGVTGSPPTLVWQSPQDPTMQFPACFDMVPIDAGGRYLNPPGTIAPLLSAFNTDWDQLLKDLDAAWQTGSAGINTALGDMFTVASDAQALFATVFNSTQPNARYGPEFMSPQ
jgi:Ferritin-like